MKAEQQSFFEEKTMTWIMLALMLFLAVTKLTGHNAGMSWWGVFLWPIGLYVFYFVAHILTWLVIAVAAFGFLVLLIGFWVGLFAMLMYCVMSS